MQGAVQYLAGLVIAWLMLALPALGCVVRGFDGEQVLASWDARDSLARQIEADGAAQGLSALQVARLAWALRLGSTAAPALTTADRDVLRRFDRTCDPPPVAAVAMAVAEPSFGFDLHLGWRQLLASALFSAVALGGVVVAAKLRATRGRRQKRYVCARPVRCLVGADPVRVCRLEDVALSGLRLSLRGARPMDPGVALVVDFGSFQMPGRVAGTSRHFTAINFDRALTRAELLHLVRPEKYPVPRPMAVGTGPAQTG